MMQNDTYHQLFLPPPRLPSFFLPYLPLPLSFLPLVLHTRFLHLCFAIVSEFWHTEYLWWLILIVNLSSQVDKSLGMFVRELLIRLISVRRITLIVGGNISWAGGLGWMKRRRQECTCVHLSASSLRKQCFQLSTSCCHDFSIIMGSSHKLWTKI